MQRSRFSRHLSHWIKLSSLAILRGVVSSVSDLGRRNLGPTEKNSQKILRVNQPKIMMAAETDIAMSIPDVTATTTTPPTLSIFHRTRLDIIESAGSEGKCQQVIAAFPHWVVPPKKKTYRMFPMETSRLRESRSDLLSTRREQGRAPRTRSEQRRSKQQR
jgi:hypothetical protein